METTTLIAGLEIFVGAIGVLFLVFAFFEYYRLQKLRSELAELRTEIKNEFYLMQKAMHRVTASYQVKDFAQKIALLKSAIEIYPAAFNGFNAIGYAYLEQNKITEAIDAFKDAVHHHPKAKEGYFDLAYAYLKKGNIEFCLQYLRDAIQIDPSSKNDLPDNLLFKEILNSPEYKKLFMD